MAGRLASLPWRWRRASGGGPPGKRGTVLVSANFGGIDDIKPLPGVAGIDAILYTDAETLARATPAAIVSWGRVMVPDHPPRELPPRLRSRYFKQQIHRLPEATPYRWCIWADSSLRFKDTTPLRGITERLSAAPPHRRVGLLAHAERSTVREEYEYIRGQIEGGNSYLTTRYSPRRMAEQMRGLASAGHDLDSPLWCGTFWVTENNDPIARCWDAWWDQLVRYGPPDQLPLPILLRQHGLEPHRLDFSIMDNPIFDWMAHRALM